MSENHGQNSPTNHLSPSPNSKMTEIEGRLNEIQNIQTKRVEALKEQIRKTKEIYRKEYEEFKAENADYNRIHKQAISINQY
mmetsp:Transcript_31874/g.31278  ORF Transcript_31874/g.31278 Transcript_31874/m.31278 type:complete len:82 (-) Transcript_31874:39-284(-)